MSLWTPSGEHSVDREPPLASPTDPSPSPALAETFPGTDADLELDTAQLDELRRQLAASPAEDVIANHCYGLFELAAVYLSQVPPLLPQAQLAIDALGAVVDKLDDRLGEAAPTLKDAVAQVRLAYVQLHAA